MGILVCFALLFFSHGIISFIKIQALERKIDNNEYRISLLRKEVDELEQKILTVIKKNGSETSSNGEKIYKNRGVIF